MSRPLRQRSLMPPRICRPIPGGLLGHINKCTLRKGEISYGIPYIQNLKRYDTNELTYKTERDSLIQRKNLWLLGEGWEKAQLENMGWTGTRLLLSRQVVSDSLRPRGLQLARLFCPWDFPGKNTGAGCRFLLQRIHTAIFKMNNQQGPTVHHRKLCSMLCGSLEGKEGSLEENGYMCMYS